MESYVLKTLKKLRKETPRLRLRNLVVICDKLIGEITEEQSANASEQPAVPTSAVEELPPKYFEPLQIACESKIPRIMDIALDSIHYMMEHGYFRGSWMPQEDDTQPDNKSKVKTKFGVVVNIICSCADEVDDTVQLQVIKVLLTVATSVYCEVHEAILLLTIRTCLNIHLMSKNSVNKATAKAALTQMLSAVNQRMESFEIKMKEEAVSNGNGTQSATSSEEQTKKEVEEEGSSNNEDANDADGHDTSVPFLSLSHKDAFLVFRALCKLSMKGLQEGGSSEIDDQRALQNRILSLELILHILQHSGPAFRSGEKFIHVIRQQLCLSLLRNCTSQISQVTSISLQIFVCLMDGFKDNLKRELEVFVANIFIRILESENATFDHKTRVLEVFHILCTETSAMVEIFINYDCDMNATDLFRRIVDGFSKITKNPSLARNAQNDFLSNNKNRIMSEEQNLRMQGLEGLVIILRTLLRTAGLSLDSTVADVTQTLPEVTSTDNNVNVRRQGFSDPYSVIASLQFETQDTTKNGTSSSDKLIGANDSEISSTNTTTQDPAISIDSISLYDRKQKMQEEHESGILKFNLSPKKGLKYLADLGHIQMNPKAVALFLFQYQSRLDKTAVGDYLGREREYENGFCLQVLHEYVDNMDFAGMKFDLAIRLFLSGFRLPGEAQKIDRLMEKFAERYYLQNRENFASADMAFILAFSTIMLQTNLHNPAIKDDKRMTKEQFIRQNKGISSDGELSDELLIEIYDRIQAQPISITQNDKEAKRVKKEEPAGFNVFQGSTLDRRRKEAFDDERKEMVRSSEEIFKQSIRKGDSVIFLRTGLDARSEEAYARPMFEIAWPPILGVLSHILETYSDPQIVELCLRAFRYAIRLACRLDFPIARHTLVNALSKFTTLDTVRPMEMKHIESINAFVSVVYSEGDWLDETWTPVLQTISQLARLQLFAEGAQTDEVFFSNDAASTSSQKSTKRSSVRASRAKSDPYGMDQIAKMFTGPSKAEVVREIEEANADLIIQEIEPTLVDKVYVNSHLLSETSIYHFVKSLCEVSMLEIRGVSTMNCFRGKDGNGDVSTPRIFSLQKLVEVADFNMGIRPRIVWANVWALLANHFSSVGINENHALAMYAVDSLKQLSIKFLQKDELSNFNFQRVFLKPFETIIVHSKALEIKDLVLRCIDIMILACASNIRSGWKSIFSIFEVTAQEKMEIASIAFGVSERLILNNFDLLVSDFVELVHCLVAFVASGHTELSLRALEHLARCSDHLASGSINSSFNNNTAIDSKLPHDISLVNQQLDEDSSVFRLWWPLLLGLSTAVGDPRLNVRSRALDTLGQVLHNHGQTFSPNAWGVIFKGILFPMIDSAKTDFTPQPESSWPTQNPPISNNRQSWIGTMATTVFNICIELFKEFEERASPVLLLSDLMKLIEDCISQESESLARIACKVYNDLIVSLARDNQGNKIDLTSYTADLICNRICKCVIQNLCIDYGEVGNVEFIEDTPSAIVELIPECPIGAHRKSKDDTDPMRSYSFDGIVKTPYGDGKFLEVSDVPSDNTEIPQRWAIALSWGAKLYTTDSNICELQTKSQSSSSSSSSRLTDAQLFKKISTAAMTSMVISLDLIKVITDAIETHFSVWKLENIASFLNALEVMFWHARSFNENFLLRSRLWRHGFMRFAHDSKTLPHLLEQEIQTLSLMQFVIIKLYQSGYDERGYPLMNKIFAEPWIQRIGSIVCQQYISLELALQSQVAVFDDKPFALQRHQAYNICVIRLLQALTKLSQQDFMSNRVWLVPILSQLILCDDRNARGILSQLYSDFINAIVL